MPYADSLLHCLKLCIHLKSKIGAKHAAKVSIQCLFFFFALLDLSLYLSQTVMSIMFSLTQVYPTESRITSLPLDINPKEHLYTKVW